LADQVFLGVLLGAVAGLAFSFFMKLSHRRGYVDRQSYVAQYLAFAIFITGLASTLGSDDLLAAFAAGSCTIIPSNTTQRANETLR
jgi:sodium/hydrogen antiporter